MKRKIRSSLSVLVWMLCLATMAYASPPPGPITGPGTVCVGSSGNYSIGSPLPHILYIWTITPAGTGVITTPGTPAPTATILFGVVGTTVITVTMEVDSTLATYPGSFVKHVNVEPLPTPLISSNVVVGCQTLNDSFIQNSGGKGGILEHILDDSTGCVKVCQGSVVTYTALGMPGDHYGWTIAGGTILAAGADTCMVLWGIPGGGSVTVSDTSAFGCVGSKTICIDIIAKPHAHFYAMPDSTSDTVNICLGQTVVFVDNSTAAAGSPIVGRFWNFGDGSYFTALGAGPVLHSYTHSGIDTATLVVKNQCGCTDTFRMIVIVNDSAGVTIICPGVVCQYSVDSYSVAPTPPCTSWLWTVEGGTITFNHDSTIGVNWNNVDTTGFGYVIFDATPCGIACPGLTVIKVPVIQTSGHITGPKVVCDNSQYLYALPQWPTTLFSWTIGGTTAAWLSHNDQNNQIVLNTQGPGIVYLQCNYTNTLLGCSGIAYDTIIVMPSDTLTGPLQVCLNTSGGTYQVGTGLNTNWTLTDPTGYTYPVYTGTTYSTPVLTIVGTYTITVTPASPAIYCPIPPYLVSVLPLPPPPDSITGPDTVCFGTPAIYTAHSPIPGDIFEWAAITGTCNAAEGNTTSATFTGSGPSAVIELWRVTTSIPHCNSDTITKTVYRPVVNINITAPDPVCPNEVYQYNSNYTQGETYSWSIIPSGDGSVQVNGLDTADILWNNVPGATPLVILQVRKCDSVYIDTFHVHIRAIPVLAISAPPSVCLHNSFMVTETTAVTGTVYWNWGDGSALSTGMTATHTYNTLIYSSTVYTITATVYNPFGCNDTVTTSVPITVLPAPVIAISPAGPFYFCPPTPINEWLYAVIATGFEPTTTMEWFKVGTVPPLASCPGPSFTCDPYDAITIGNYYVVALGANGCNDTSNIVLVDTVCSHGTMPCTMNPTPWAVIDTALVNCGSVYLHGAYSTAPGLTALSEYWTWPGTALGVTTTSTTLNCYFNVAGNYDFQYHVRFADTLGDTCWFTYDTSVLVPLIAGSLNSVTCTSTGYQVTLYDHSNYYPGHNPVNYSWYINNGFIANTTSSSYTVNLPPGAYNLCEWVHYNTNPAADSCLACDSLYLPALPVAGFTFAHDTTCAQLASVQFTNTSSPGGLSFMWNFGDGTSNLEADPFKVYAGGAFIYTVTLTAMNSYGCVSTYQKQVPIIADDLFGTLLGAGNYCAGAPVLLKYHTTGSNPYPDKYYWLQGIDTMYSTTINTTYVYNSGSYWVIGTNHYGCYVDVLPAVVNIIQVPPAVITGKHNTCINVPYTLSGWVGNDPNVGYQWFKNSVPDGTGSTVTDPAAYVTTVPDTFKLVVSIHMGTDTCRDTSAIFLVTVNPLPPAPTIMPGILSCASYTFSLLASGPTWGSYNWSNGGSGNPITVMGGGPYAVWYTDTFGCTSFGSTYVDKDPRAYLWIFPTGCYEWCSIQTPTPFIVGPIIPFVYWAYQYAPVGPVITAGSGVPNYFWPPASGDYDLILQNMWCRDTSGIMDVTIDSNCACNCFKITANGYSTPCNPPKTGCCQWNLSLCINNGCSPVNAVISSSTGTFSPLGGSFTINPGSSCDTFVYTPTGSFGGGWVYFTITWVDPVSGKKEHCPDSVYYAPCGGNQTNCSCFRFSTTSWAESCAPPAKLPSGCCWGISLCIYNGCEKASATISSGSGTFTPPSFTIPTGYACDTFTFTPTGSFSGGWLYFTITWTDLSGNKYNCPDSVYLNPCGVKSRHSSSIQQADGEALLALVPNPAQNSTRVDYGLTGNATNGAIEVYDMTGRLITTYTITSNEGSWQLMLDNYPAGVYMVVLKENGTVVKQSKLSVIR